MRVDNDDPCITDAQEREVNRVEVFVYLEVILPHYLFTGPCHIIGAFLEHSCCLLIALVSQ